MITTSKGFLGTLINNEAAVISDFNWEEDLDLIINEDCGDITIGEWAFLQEGDIDDAKIQLLEEVLDKIDTELLEAGEFMETLEFEDDEEAECLDEAVKTTIKKIAKIAKEKSMKAAKKAGYVAGKAGKAAIDKLKTAASAASTKARDFASKARDLAAKGAKSAADKAKAMASKFAAKAKALAIKVKEAIRRFRGQGRRTGVSIKD